MDLIQNLNMFSQRTLAILEDGRCFCVAQGIDLMSPEVLLYASLQGAQSTSAQSVYLHFYAAKLPLDQLISYLQFILSKQVVEQRNKLSHKPACPRQPTTTATPTWRTLVALQKGINKTRWIYADALFHALIFTVFKESRAHHELCVLARENISTLVAEQAENKSFYVSTLTEFK